MNRRDESAEARSVEDAIAVLALKESEAEADRHPERCDHHALSSILLEGFRV